MILRSAPLLRRKHNALRILNTMCCDEVQLSDSQQNVKYLGKYFEQFVKYSEPNYPTRITASSHFNIGLPLFTEDTVFIKKFIDIWIRWNSVISFEYVLVFATSLNIFCNLDLKCARLAFLNTSHRRR